MILIKIAFIGDSLGLENTAIAKGIYKRVTSGVRIYFYPVLIYKENYEIKHDGTQYRKRRRRVAPSFSFSIV